ncbi:hypothetical protein J2800_001690 [Caulobacter rhizosphaerae]|uniref:Apea-like HEPN domain-containing protein n=1 Tax=Caulobacter rhizosphaerae TaxID=2010972 RepID=A0ABU1MYG4_9CAUL|nr:hypothetical protein [Caulobacter rhizosphaerae]MDR6530951.1 hypothetical protein [Caulobacter rhizosphaerae]
MALNLDLKAALEIAAVGVRRAHAFMAIGLQATEGGPVKSARLPMTFSFQVLPDPLPDELAEKITEEYQAWLTGSGLRELDLYFSLFIDRLWWIADAAELAGQRVPWDHVIGGSFDKDTNVARKVSKVAERIGCQVSKVSYFDSLSRARNSLIHGSGQVRDRDALDGILLLRWMCPEVSMRQNGGEEIIRHDSPSMEVTDPNGAEIIMRFAEREKPFALGEKIKILPHELSEICFFYQHQASVLIRSLEVFLRDRGMFPPTPVVAES